MYSIIIGICHANFHATQRNNIKALDEFDFNVLFVTK